MNKFYKTSSLEKHYKLPDATIGVRLSRFF